MSRTWFAFRTAPRKETVAEIILTRQGFDAFTPTETRLRRISRHSARKKEFKFAVMPGYMLIGFESSEVPWHKVRRLNVVHSVVGCGSRPIPIAHDSIEYLRSLTKNEADATEHKGVFWSVKVGDEIEITGGPFGGFRSRIDKIEGEIADCDVSVFGRPTLLHIPLDMLKAA